MIPLPPPDSRLPGLQRAMVADEIAPVFEEAFGVAVRGCHPYYVRYKPEKYLCVQYRLSFDGTDGQSRTLANLSIYPPARAAKLAARHSPVGGTRYKRTRSVYIDRMHGLAQIFPVDFDLPGLYQAASPQAMAHRLSGEPFDVLGGRVRDCRVELVRYKAHKRAVLKYDLDGTAVRTVFGKLRQDGASSLHRTGAAMDRAGAPTPRTLAWLPDLGMVVQAAATGTRLADLRGTNDYSRWMPAAADALARLQACRIEGLPLHADCEEVRDLQSTAATIGRLVPSLAATAGRLSQRLGTALVTRDGPITTTHGSFHDDQVLVGDGRVVLVDTDGAVLGHPHSDVGHFLSYLSAEEDEDAYGRFLDSYFSARPTERGHEYLLFEAASLLRWATLPFRELRADWPGGIEKRVHLAAARLHDFESRG